MRWYLVVYALAAAASCAGSSSRQASGPRPRSDLLTPEEIQRAQWGNAYDLVRNLRPQWLRTRTSSRLSGQSGEVQVLLDGVSMGGVSVLRNLPVTGFTFVQYYDPITAAARWGLGFGNGAISITTGSR